MATVTYTFTRICAGGDHISFDVSFNGGAAQNVGFDIDEIRKPLSSLAPEERIDAAALLLRIHIAGRTRAQIVTEFQNPVVITV